MVMLAFVALALIELVIGRARAPWLHGVVLGLFFAEGALHLRRLHRLGLLTKAPRQIYDATRASGVPPVRSHPLDLLVVALGFAMLLV